MTVVQTSRKICGNQGTRSPGEQELGKLLIPVSDTQALARPWSLEGMLEVRLNSRGILDLLSC